MSVSEKTRRALKEFGLTEYEAKVYVSLVESGTQAASELSSTASIPYSKIYEILGNLERKVGELQPLYEKKGAREKPDIWIVRGQNNILDKIRETLGRTRRELFVAMPVAPDPIVSMALPVLALMKSKEVNVSVMVPQTTSRDTIRKLKGLAQVRTREQMFGGGIISDDNQIVILLGEDPQKGLTLAISSDHIGLVKFGKSYFEYLWESSKPLS